MDPDANPRPIAESSQQASRPAEQNRLPPKGYHILRGYFYNHVNQFPNPAQMQELHAKLQEIPGCQSYTVKNIKGWFKNKQKRETKPLAARKSTKSKHLVRNALYPSIKLEQLKTLEALFRDNQNPSPRTIEIWAKSLESEKSDIEKWVELKLEKAKPFVRVDGLPEGVHRGPQLPTPESSQSPEPRTPTAHKEATNRWRGLAGVIQESLSSEPSDADKILSSIPDFVSCFESHEREMQKFMGSLQNGDHDDWAMNTSS